MRETCIRFSSCLVCNAIIALRLGVFPFAFRLCLTAEIKHLPRRLSWIKSRISGVLHPLICKEGWWLSAEKNHLYKKLIISYWFPGCFPLCQKFRKFGSEFKWKGSFRFLLTGIFGITSGSGPHISVGTFRPKFAILLLTNRFFALIREFGNKI